MRLGHVNFDSLKMMAQKEMLKGLSSIIHLNQLCEGCLVGKQFCKTFPKESISRASQPLQKIHLDVYGPIKPCLFGKNLHFLLFIDDYNRRTWLYFLKKQSNVFNFFKKFMALVEKQNGYSIKSLFKFCSNDFNEFCEDCGIKRLLKVIRSPQQKGIVDRKNISVINMARSMLKTKKILKEFWTEAIDCAIYFSNRFSTKGLNGMTP
jgi:hypothetical protein